MFHGKRPPRATRGTGRLQCRVFIGTFDTFVELLSQNGPNRRMPMAHLLPGTHSTWRATGRERGLGCPRFQHEGSGIGENEDHQCDQNVRFNDSSFTEICKDPVVGPVHMLCSRSHGQITRIVSLLFGGELLRISRCHAHFGSARSH